ncbi:hypothetical protein M775_03670 [Neisseria gonorrhoeae MU_NG6]|nr:hypothetical protein M771_09570 [Neisseria gonorrhoeae MU_NG1]KLS89455.1 hypothetical protein M775_03670 [Neisseria gonorrhoeae MU_NG6]
MRLPMVQGVVMRLLSIVGGITQAVAVMVHAVLLSIRKNLIIAKRMKIMRGRVLRLLN